MPIESFAVITVPVDRYRAIPLTSEVTVVTRSSWATDSPNQFNIVRGKSDIG